jgi:hypothetical protein
MYIRQPCTRTFSATVNGNGELENALEGVEVQDGVQKEFDHLRKNKYIKRKREQKVL